MHIRTTIPPGATNLAAVDAIMALYGRENVELAIETLIERLDIADGEPDDEPEDDACFCFEDAGTGSDRFRCSGCAVADMGDDDDAEYTMAEWLSLPAAARRAGSFAGKALDICCLGLADDTEDADAAEDDGVDCCAAGDDDLNSLPAIRADWDFHAGPGDEIDAEYAWPEWHTRGRHKLDKFGSECRADKHGWYPCEDHEDDDRDTGVEDGRKGFDPEEDRCTALDDVVTRGVCMGGASWHMLVGSEDDEEINGDEGDNEGPDPQA